MTFSYPIRSWERLGPHPIILYGVTFQKRRTKEINHSVERNKKKLPEGTNIFWALQTWAPRPPSWLKWTATACVFFVLFLPQGTSSFIFRGCVTMGRTFQGRVTSSGILKLSPLTLLAASRWVLEHYPPSSGKWTWHWNSFEFLFVFWLIDWLVVFCFLFACFALWLWFFLFSQLLLPQTISLRLYITQFACF